MKTKYLIDEGKEFRACQNIRGERGQKESGKMSSLGGNYSCIVWYEIVFCLVQNHILFGTIFWVLYTL